MGLYTKSLDDKPPKVIKEKVEKKVRRPGRPKKVVEEKTEEPEVEKVEEEVKEEPPAPEKPLELPGPVHTPVLPETPLVLVEEKASKPKPKKKVQPVHENVDEKKTKSEKKEKKKPVANNSDKEPPGWFKEFWKSMRSETSEPQPKLKEAKQIASDIWRKRQPKIKSSEGSDVDKIFNQIFGR